jgi:hypothetical protein
MINGERKNSLKNLFMPLSERFTSADKRVIKVGVPILSS